MTEKSLKEIILNFLQNKHLLSANQILILLEKNGTAYNKTSVYRSLDQLEEQDLVCKHYFGEAEAYYELRDHHHTHLFCKNCGLIQIADCSFQQQTDLKDFKADHHHVTIIGLCKACQAE